MSFDFPMFLVLATLVTGGIWLFDALVAAPRRKRLVQSQAPNESAESEERAPQEPLLVEYARSFFPVILVVLVLRSFLVEPFRIPSGSMMPTLLAGDFILVNKFSYGLRLPVLDRKIVDIGEPQRGDVVVFRYPRDPSTDYIKRLVGIPGDRIAYRNKTLYINDEPQPQTPFGYYQGAGSGARMTGALESREQLGTVEHSILTVPRAPDLPYGCQVLAQGEVVVPAGHYFVMGDNRDSSNDSRCWGFVPERNLVGKAFGIWMSWDLNRTGFPIAWERLGKGIE